MKCIADKAELWKAAAIAERACSSRSPLPVLTSLLIDVGEGRATFTGSDLDVTLRSACAVETEEPGVVCVPADTFMRVVKDQPGPQIRLALNTETQRLTVKSGRSNYQVPIYNDPTEFPPVPAIEDGQGFAIRGDGLLRGLERVLPAVALDDTRPVLTAVLWRTGGDDGKLLLVSTDTHRLHVTREPIGEGGGSIMALVPGSTCAELVKLIVPGDPCAVSVGKNLIELSSTWGVLTSRLIEGQYPHYERVIPKHTRGITMRRAELADAIKRAAVVARGSADRITARYDGQGSLTLTANSEEFGAAEEILEVVDGAVDEGPIGLNQKQVRDAIGAVAGEFITLRRAGMWNPVEFVGSDPEEFLAVVMPMQLDGQEFPTAGN